MAVRPLARVLLVLAVAALGSIVASSAHAARHAAAMGTVIGYADDATAPRVLSEQASAITDVGVDGVTLNGDAEAVSPPSEGALALLRRAHSLGLRAELLVSNFGVSGNASTREATRLLTSPARRARVAAALVALVARQGWDGVTVDLEQLTSGDAPGLTAFVAALRHELPARAPLSVDVGATTSAPGYAALGYKLGALAAVATVVVMAYDEDGPWSGPGPIGGLRWQLATLAAARSLVPARRLVLGVPAYGYTWPPGRRLHDGTAVSARQARAMARASRATPSWDAAAGEWTVRLRGGTVLWWADVRSYRLRVRVASRLGLAGLAIWQLSSADRLPARGP